MSSNEWNITELAIQKEISKHTITPETSRKELIEIINIIIDAVWAQGIINNPRIVISELLKTYNFSNLQSLEYDVWRGYESVWKLYT